MVSWLSRRTQEEATSPYGFSKPNTPLQEQEGTTKSANSGTSLNKPDVIGKERLKNCEWQISGDPDITTPPELPQLAPCPTHGHSAGCVMAHAVQTVIYTLELKRTYVEKQHLNTSEQGCYGLVLDSRPQ